MDMANNPLSTDDYIETSSPMSHYVYYDEKPPDIILPSLLSPDYLNNEDIYREIPTFRERRSFNNDNQNLLSPQTPATNRSSDIAFDFVDETAPLRQDEDEIFLFQNFNVWMYFKREMFGIGEPGHLDSDAVSTNNIRNFFRIPFQLENLLVFGFFICLDAFLFILTYLPVRIIYSIILLIFEISYKIYAAIFVSNKVKRRKRKRNDPGIFFHRTNLYDMMRGFLFVFGCIYLHLLDMSRVYHFIRGQSMIKLYVLTGMMEMLDKLFSSFGQDTFGSLYYQIRKRPDQILELLKLTVIACGYIALHSTIYFINIATLAVAVNSSDRALLTVLILNNVSEIKSFVFKKFDKTNLFQLSCSDITERFHIGLFLSCISLGGIAQAGPSYLEAIYSHAFVFILFYFFEMMADYVKHAFIAKFNEIDANVYEEFVKVLRNDILNSHKDKIILDQTYAITRRVGLSQVIEC